MYTGDKEGEEGDGETGKVIGTFLKCPNKKEKDSVFIP